VYGRVGLPRCQGIFRTFLWGGLRLASPWLGQRRYGKNGKFPPSVGKKSHVVSLIPPPTPFPPSPASNTAPRCRRTSARPCAPPRVIVPTLSYLSGQPPPLSVTPHPHHTHSKLGTSTAVSHHLRDSFHTSTHSIPPPDPPARSKKSTSLLRRPAFTLTSFPSRSILSPFAFTFYSSCFFFLGAFGSGWCRAVGRGYEDTRIRRRTTIARAVHCYLGPPIPIG
jgi:hypothetical protein